MTDEREFSNYDKNVFIINLKKQIDRGALMSRYSRAHDLDIRALWEKEFKNNPERGEKFYERVFVEYGDESIAELVNAQVGVQNVSNLVTKIIEEGRIGLSYIEKSSRYVSYLDKKDGRFLYLEASKTGLPESMWNMYEEECDFLFESYSAILNGVINELYKEYPMENMKFEFQGKEYTYDEIKSQYGDIVKKAYESAIRSRGLDEARYLLPSSTLTNLGISGNARAYIRLLYRLLSSHLPEARNIGIELKKELTPFLTKLIDSMDKDYGLQQLDYEKSMNSVQFMDEEGYFREEVKLLKFPEDEDASKKLAAAYLFQRSNLDYSTLEKKINLKEIKISPIINEIASRRKNRRNKVGREAENLPYSFEIATNFGAFREIQRHRTMTIIRKPLTVKFGYQIPPTVLKNKELLELFNDAMKRSAETYFKLKEYDINLAQYAVTFAHIYPIYIVANLREIIYFTELRSTPQAHFDLRRISQNIYKEIEKVNPSITPLFKFVDHNEYPLGRLRAEIRKEKKLKDLEKDQN